MGGTPSARIKVEDIQPLCNQCQFILLILQIHEQVGSRFSMILLPKCKDCLISVVTANDLDIEIQFGLGILPCPHLKIPGTASYGTIRVEFPVITGSRMVPELISR